jgi:Protein of unknown function (DUF3014)
MTAVRVVAIVVLLLFAAGTAFYLWQRGQPAQLPSPLSAPSSAPTAPAPAAPRYPLEAPPPAPVPTLKESDPSILEALATLFGVDPLRQFFNPEELVRRIVVTIDNLPRKEFAADLSPMKGPGGLPRVTGKDDTLALAPDNAARYAPYVRLAESVDASKAVALYARFYPLFQQAYVELGFPAGYFNDRLIEVIDHLLDAPEERGPLRVVAPHVLYEYADPELESRSSGQKLLLRMGPDNAARIKAKLREIRGELMKQVRKP